MKILSEFIINFPKNAPKNEIVFPKMIIPLDFWGFECEKVLILPYFSVLPKTKCVSQKHYIGISLCYGATPFIILGAICVIKLLFHNSLKK